MSTQRIDILTPVGRLVAGDVFKANTTDQKGNPLLVKKGPNAGQPKVEYFFAIAIPKTDPAYNTEVMAKLQAAARTGFPTLFDASGNCIRPDFAWKIVDGDSRVPNQNNVIPATKEGYPGHWVVSFKGGYAPKVYTKGGEALITDPEMLKKGYYIRVYGTVTGNEDMQKPGVYLNPSMVEFVGYGEEIISGPDGAAVFGGAPAANLPAGASAIPMAGTPIAMPSNMPAAPVATAPAVAPAPDFLNPQSMAVPAAPAAPAAPVERSFNISGQMFTESQLRAGGWTDAQLATLG